MSTNVDQETLEVYHASIKVVAWADPLLEAISKHLAVHNPLDRASTSIRLNIVEGNGKYTSADRCRFFDVALFDIARGSILE